jgi:NAD(P)-dependent dehydrogenase (short-subunit alcohol dehydrogenase family)
MTELNGTVAVVTGAGRGIGREVALRQAQRSARVAVPGTLIADIAAGRFDPFAGRLLRGVEDRGLLEQEMEDIVARDARALRFSGVEQAKL